MPLSIDTYRAGYRRFLDSPGPFNRYHKKKVGWPKRAAAGALKALDLTLLPFCPRGERLEQIRVRLVGPSNAAISSVVDAAWEEIRINIQEFDPRVADKKEAFLSKFYHAMKRVFSEILTKALQGNIDPFVRLNLNMFSPETEDPHLYDSTQEIRVGFFPIAGNPLNWGHLLAPLMSLAHLSMDTLVVRVQGEIGYKKLLACERVSAADRHSLVREAIKGLYPLVRYTDLGSEENNNLEGTEEMYRFMRMNAGRRMCLFYLIGAENEARMWNYMRQQYRMMKKYHYGKNSLHRVTFSVIQRGEYGKKVTLEALREISRKVREQEGWEREELDIVLIKDPEIDMHVSSTYYRATQDGAFVPRVVHEWARANGFYGHPPIDPLTGQPVTDNQETYFRMQLEPVAREMADQIKAVLANDCPAKMPLISIDGGSGSGKTTVAEEVAKYLDEQGIDCEIIGLDMLLKDRAWRMAVQKLVTGRKLTGEERELVGSLADRIQSDQVYTGEEDFFDREGVFDLIHGIDSFRRSSATEYSKHLPDAYDQETKTRGPRDIVIKKPVSGRPRVIIIEGKYANEEELQPFFDLRYRLHDDPDRTEARFQIRSRRGSPNDADMQVVFYQLSLEPSYETYDQRTQDGISAFIDLRGEEWRLVAGKR